MDIRKRKLARMARHDVDAARRWEAEVNRGLTVGLGFTPREMLPCIRFLASEPVGPNYPGARFPMMLVIPLRPLDRLCNSPWAQFDATDEDDDGMTPLPVTIARVYSTEYDMDWQVSRQGGYSNLGGPFEPILLQSRRAWRGPFDYYPPMEVGHSVDLRGDTNDDDYGWLLDWVFDPDF